MTTFYMYDVNSLDFFFSTSGSSPRTRTGLPLDPSANTATVAQYTRGTVKLDDNYKVGSFQLRDGAWDDIDTAVQQGVPLVAPATLFGTDYPRGTLVNVPYAVRGVDANGDDFDLYPVGIVDSRGNLLSIIGVMSTIPLTPDTSYRLSYSGGSVIYEDFGVDSSVLQEPLPAPCLVRGTHVATPGGPVKVEDLAVGDLVTTRDNGPQPLRWIGMARVRAQVVADDRRLRPIRISAGALGAGLPLRDLFVSPQHRVLVSSAIAQRMFGTREVLVAAKQLCQLPGIDYAEVSGDVDYFHLLFDRHEVILTEGAPTESLFTGPQALQSIGAAARDEIFALFPDLADDDTLPDAARPLASGRMGRKLAVRHLTNDKPLI
ncbi:Hint domain-containing protein [Paracoccus sp. p3-h83]|uniref:Hint domain-containing protein n=1 Tax=Paracoccus sp. p3-h83 TaxID=3342805 RepID=UPI0035BA4793